MAAICQHVLEVHDSSGARPRIAYVCGRMEHPDDPWHERELGTENGTEYLVDVDTNVPERQRVVGSRLRWRA